MLCYVRSYYIILRLFILYKMCEERKKNSPTQKVRKEIERYFKIEMVTEQRQIESGGEKILTNK